MAKIKIQIRTPRIDMTPMVDMFFLLLTFFMLTTSFRPQEAVQVDTPSSISDKITPEKDVITVFLSKTDKVYFNVDNGHDTSMHVRRKVLLDMAKQYKIMFTAEQLDKFEKLSSFGMPIKDVAAWIDAPDAKTRESMQTGIPIDTLNNQLAMWVLFARKANPDAEAAIKGDEKADYKTAKRVFDILQDTKINRFNLTTNLETVIVKIQDAK
jgi:biopolymer transport protein ExbD